MINNKKQIIFLIAASVSLLFNVISCQKSNNSKEVVYIQQKGQINTDEWYDVIVVFGFVDNYENAERILETLTKTSINPMQIDHCKYRLVVRKTNLNRIVEGRQR